MRERLVRLFGPRRVFSESMIVMRGLDPRIHLFDEGWIAGSRVKPGNDVKALLSKYDAL
jgi:hypothetical protein